ncbi:MAG: 4Fe-4S dicluster domain-containing protein [Acidimicrobiales bacterium]
MRYGFAIDQRTCIGCHACTVACKTEHEVPVGQFRTWVKYVDSGTFPNSTRSFGVMRCNHCTNAPCIKICPTGALFKRPDGIVDFNADDCIGCKSCMQACPYDALYIDADTHTAAKCNFCAHRVDAGLEPACVSVCPTHSIWVGDLDDEESGIARLIGSNVTAVRGPEHNTEPNVFYLGADQAVLDPLAAPVDKTYLWARPDTQRLRAAVDLASTATEARTTLNTAHDRPWGWRVIGYTWTKGVAAGVLALAGVVQLLAMSLGVSQAVVPATALGLAAITGILLVWDLKRPERFLYIFLKSNLSSWLVWGAYALTGLSAVALVWLLTVLPGIGGGFRDVLAWLAIFIGAIAAGYTGLLFGQAKGRDLWQSPLLFWHLLVQATMAGAGVLLVLAAIAGSPVETVALVVRVLVAAAAMHLVVLVIEHAGRHGTRHAQVATRIIARGRYARLFWAGAVAPTVISLVLAAALGWDGGGVTPAMVVAGLLVQVSVLAYETVFVWAGQDVPLS